MLNRVDLNLLPFPTLTLNDLKTCMYVKSFGTEVKKLPRIRLFGSFQIFVLEVTHVL